MSGLPNGAVWSIVVQMVLLSPVIARLLALAAEIAVWAVVYAGAPTGVALAAVAGLLILMAEGAAWSPAGDLRRNLELSP
jgi:hypothetical protein